MLKILPAKTQIRPLLDIFESFCLKLLSVLFKKISPDIFEYKTFLPLFSKLCNVSGNEAII